MAFRTDLEPGRITSVLRASSTEKCPWWPDYDFDIRAHDWKEFDLYEQTMPPIPSTPVSRLVTQEGRGVHPAGCHASRGEFVSHDEVGRQIKRILSS